MEPVTHFLTGECIGRAGFNRRTAYATLAATLAAEAPDIDVLWGLGGPIVSFQHHRGITHTFIAAPFVALATTCLIWLLDRFFSRWLASRKAAKATIPAIVRQVSDEQTLEMTIVENLQRADLNAMEQARAYQRLSQEFKLTQEQMATRTGKERASVSNFLRLLKLPEPIQQKVESGDLSFGHARTLLALDSSEAITAAAQKVMALSMSVRQTESYVQGLINPEAKEKKESKADAQPEDPNVREAQDRIRRTLGLKVRIEDKNGKGRVIIEYSGLEDFDSILTALGGQ